MSLESLCSNSLTNVWNINFFMIESSCKAYIKLYRTLRAQLILTISAISHMNTCNKFRVMKGSDLIAYSRIILSYNLRPYGRLSLLWWRSFFGFSFVTYAITRWKWHKLLKTLWTNNFCINSIEWPNKNFHDEKQWWNPLWYFLTKKNCHGIKFVLQKLVLCTKRCTSQKLNCLKLSCEESKLSTNL